MSSATVLSLPTPSARILVGNSVPMQELRRRLTKLARSPAPVFIGGETGSGKELVARALHAESGRREGPFVAVNCGAIPNDLLESEFFGHRKGSFTNAERDHPGLFQAAAGGSLFLDEVAELPLSMQAKLLRALQERSVRPLGATRETPVDVRLISASHKDLRAEVKAGRLRQDLYYRLHVLHMHVPALRERREDLALLVEHLLVRLSRELGQSFRISTAALSLLETYDFPGNVRELDNLLQCACALAESPELQACDFASLLPREREVIAVEESSLRISLPHKLSSLAQQEILQALHHCRWNRTAAARQLGLTPRALRYRLQKLGLT